MNLWVRSLRQLTLLAVALFFFSCEDETSILGFKSPNRKFKVNYVDIPLESDVFLMDSLRTANSYVAQAEPPRMLVGHYNDEHFGEVSAVAFSQFFTTNTAKTALKETAALDSVSLQLKFDFYTFGSDAASPQTIRVHEVQKELLFDSLGYYFNKTETPYNPTPLGIKTFSFEPETFRKFVSDNKDTTITIRIPLDFAFGQRIFDSAMKYRTSTSPADSTFVRIRDFVKEFNGIAIVPEAADKIIGFNPASATSRITLHYHDADTDSLQLNLTFNGMVNYNHIEADRSATPALSALQQYAQPIVPDNNLRYVQAGTGVLTRLDFQKFYDFVDADSNAAMIVNEAEVHLGAPESTSGYDPVNAFTLRAIQHAGYFRKVRNMADSVSIGLYAGQLNVLDGMFAPFVPGRDGRPEPFIISRSGENNFYNGYLTLFAQQLFKKEAQKERFRYFALYPQSPGMSKSVNRVVLNKENIMIRVYYTRPNEATP